MSWRKEKKEHPTFTVAQAKQIAKDHAAKKHHNKYRHTKPAAANSGPIQTAKTDNNKLYNGYSNIVKRTRSAI